MNRTRYLAIVQWAAKRYQRGDNLMVSTRGTASRYKIIETLAAERYMGCTPRTRPRLAFPPVFQAPAWDEPVPALTE